MSQVDDWADGYADSARDVNLYGPASANVPRSSVVSHQVRYRAPDTSDIPLAPGQNPGGSVYSNASGARMGQTKPASGYRAPAGGGWDVNSSDTNLRFPNESGGKQYRTTRQTKKSAVRKSATPSGDDVTSTVVQAVRADGNTSFANWRQSLKNEGWTEEQANAIVYDPSSGKFINTAKSPSSGGALTPDEQAMAERAASHRAETPAAETPAAETPAKTDTRTSAPVSGAQPAPADDHEQEAKAAVDEFLKQHPVDGKERLKSIYAAVDSQNIKDDAAYNLAVMAEIQKAQTPAPVPGRSFITTENTGDNHVPDFPAGVRAESAITAIGNMLRSFDPERYKYADAMDGNIVTPDSIRAAEYVRQLRAANAAKAQAAAEAAEQRSDNPEGWL